MITIKDYASSRGISYEAVRQSIKRHHSEVSEHLHKQGRKTLLDAEAVEILDRYRNNTVTVQPQTNVEQLEYISALKDEIIRLQNENAELLKERQKGIEASVRLELMTNTTEKQERKIEALETELRAYHKTIFGLYRKASPEK